MAASTENLLGRLDNASDWISPIVVKEVRQIVRGREFLLSFALSLIAGLLVASVGGTAQGNAAGATIFTSLMTCLTLLGLIVVPMGTFMALRNERMERTFDLVMLTTLPPRRIAIGKILAQGVKLTTLFATLAPFMAMSFLLGGIDLLTILLSLGMLYMWSLWACALCLFLSSAVKSRAMSGAVLVLLGLGFFILFVGGGGASIFYLLMRPSYGGGYYGGPGGSMWSMLFGGVGGPGGGMWWGVAATVSLCLVSMANLILLAENCLSLEDEDHTFALRVGLMAQFLMIVLWCLASRFLPSLSAAPSSMFGAMVFFCTVQLVIEALFMVTGDLAMSRRTRLRDKPTKYFSWLTVIFRPGSGRAITYLLLKMIVLLGAGYLITRNMEDARWLAALLGYVAFYTGLPAYVGRLITPRKSTAMRLRAAVLLTFLAGMILPEVATYFTMSSSRYEPYALRHILNPFVTLAEWAQVDLRSRVVVLALGLVGLLAYVRMIMMARKENNSPPIRAAVHAR